MFKAFDIFDIFKVFSSPSYGEKNIYESVIENGSFEDDKSGWSEYNCLPEFPDDDAYIPYGSDNSSLLQAVCLPEEGEYFIDIHVKETTSSAFVTLFERGQDFSFPLNDLPAGHFHKIQQIDDPGIWYFGPGVNRPGDALIGSVELRYLGDNAGKTFVNGDFKAYDYGWSPNNTLPVYSGSGVKIPYMAKNSCILQSICPTEGTTEIVVDIAYTGSSGYVVFFKSGEEMVRIADNLTAGKHTIKIDIPGNSGIYFVGIGTNEGGDTTFKSISVDCCSMPDTELLYNYEFGCGLTGWHFDPEHPADLTDNGDGSIHIDAIEQFGSVVPDKQEFEADHYVLEIDVANVVGNGKMSIRKSNGLWTTIKQFTTEGTHTAEFIGQIKDIHCGANGDTSFECDFSRYSLMKLKDYCPLEDGELLYNHSFDCGTVAWGFDPNYTAVITDNGNGSVHLRTTSNYGSVVPDYDVFPIDTYILEIEVANVSGNGKMSIRNSHNTWFNLETFNTDGVYTVEYSGNIKDIHCGAAGDPNFECDFLSYSLMTKLNYCKPRGDELVSNWTFYCDGMDWERFNANVTYGNSQVTIVRTGLSASVRQRVWLEAGKTYRMETKILSTDSSTFISVTDPNGATSYPADYLDAGVHGTDFTPTKTGEHMVGIGNNSPNGSSSKFDYLSVKEI